MSTPARRPHVVIVGGGFGGLYAARALAGSWARVTLLDRRNHHLFQPLLYQVATAALNPSDIATPLRSILRRAANVTVLLAEVRSVDLAGRRVILDEGELTYDALVLAAGAGNSYFGHDDWEELAPSLKSLEDALEIRRRVLLAYEDAERERDGAEQRALLTSVVIGGGPTGVELAGALAEISRETIARDFRLIDPTKARIVLVEAGPRLLASFPAPLSAHAAAALARLGVEVRTGAPVTQVTHDAVWLGGEQIRARTVLWAAGVAASPLARSLGVPLDRAGRVLVEPDLSIPGHADGVRHRRHVERPRARRPPAPGPGPGGHPAGPGRRGERAAPPAPACRPGPSATATRAAWPPSAAPPRSRWSAASSSTACPRGSPGSSCTSCS